MSPLCLLPVVLVAQVALSPAEAWDKIAPLNAQLQEAAARLPKRFGADPAAERAAVDAAAKTLEEVKAGIGDDDFPAGDALAKLMANVAALESDVASARVVVELVGAASVVASAHAAGTPADDAAYERLAKSAEALTSLPPGWAKVGDWARGRATRLRDERDEIGAQASAAKLGALFVEANRARRALDRGLEDEPGRVDPTLLTALGDAADAVTAVDDAAARFYLAELSRYRLNDLWRIEDEVGRNAAISGELDGVVAGSGVAKGTRLKVNLAVEAGHCYSLMMRFSSVGVGEALEELAVTGPKGAVLLRYDQVSSGIGAQRTEGFCTTGAGRVSVSAKVTRGARGNTVRWVALDWPRAEIPVAHAASLRLLPADRCDDDGWYAQWATPVPGTVVYQGDEPRLLVRAGDVGNPSVSLVDVNGATVEATKAELRSLAAGQTRFSTPFRFAGCAEGTTAPDALRLSQCERLVEKRFARQIERAEKRVERAAEDTAVAAAQETVDALRAKEKAERDRKCLPQRSLVEGRLKRAYDRILDLFSAGAPAAVVDRAAELQSWERAKPELR